MLSARASDRTGAVTTRSRDHARPTDSRTQPATYAATLRWMGRCLRWVFPFEALFGRIADQLDETRAETRTDFQRTLIPLVLFGHVEIAQGAISGPNVNLIVATLHPHLPDHPRWRGRGAELVGIADLPVEAIERLADRVNAVIDGRFG